MNSKSWCHTQTRHRCGCGNGGHIVKMLPTLESRKPPSVESIKRTSKRIQCRRTNFVRRSSMRNSINIFSINSCQFIVLRCHVHRSHSHCALRTRRMAWPLFKWHDGFQWIILRVFYRCHSPFYKYFAGVWILSIPIELIVFVVDDGVA